MIRKITSVARGTRQTNMAASCEKILHHSVLDFEKKQANVTLTPKYIAVEHISHKQSDSGSSDVKQSKYGGAQLLTNRHSNKGEVAKTKDNKEKLTRAPVRVMCDGDTVVVSRTEGVTFFFDIF